LFLIFEVIVEDLCLSKRKSFSESLRLQNIYYYREHIKKQYSRVSVQE